MQCALLRSRWLAVQRALDGSVGFRFAKTCAGGPLEVTHVHSGSPAARSVVHPGDLICAVNGKSVEDLDLDEVADLFRSSPPNSLITLQVQSVRLREEGLNWVVRGGKLPPQNLPEFGALLSLLQSVALSPSEVSCCRNGAVIGQGAHGSVVKTEMNGMPVAVKHVNPQTQKALPQLFREMLLELTVTIDISRFSHPNVVDFLGAAVHFPSEQDAQIEWTIGLVFELCDPYDLYHLLHKVKINLTVAQKTRLARESAAGLAHIHSLNVLHRDFGSRNLLLKEGHIKITDFGLARKLKPGLCKYQPSTVCGTLPWMAPEQIAGQELSPFADVFSLGTVLWELFSEAVPFSDLNDPLIHNMPLMRSCLNTRDLALGGWPFGSTNVRAGSTMPLSRTLQPLSQECLRGIAGDVKCDISLLLSLMHQHVPVFRPTAEEAHTILLSMEQRLAMSTWSLQRLLGGGDGGCASAILEGLHERVEVSEVVASHYLKRDQRQLARLDTAFWCSTLGDPGAWAREQEHADDDEALIALMQGQTGRSSVRVMERRKKVLENSVTLLRPVGQGEAPRRSFLGTDTPRSVVSQLLGGVLGVASWVVGPIHTARILKVTDFAKQMLAMSFDHSRALHNLLLQHFVSLTTFYGHPAPSSRVYAGQTSPVNLCEGLRPHPRLWGTDAKDAVSGKDHGKDSCIKDRPPSCGV